MYNKNYDCLNKHLEDKKKLFSIRVTTYIKGSVKNQFISDCLKREMHESKVAAKIIESYYEIINENPSLIEKEIPEIKNWIKDRIKL